MNQSTTSQSLLQNKKEMFHIQIRKEKREEIFKQKRVIQKMHETQEQLLINPENFEYQITEWMKECLNIYNKRLPTDFEMLLDNIRKLRKLQILDQGSETFTLCLFKNDFIEFLMAFLSEQFDATPYIQVDAATILANFFGSMNKQSKYYFSTYIPMLNLLGDAIIKYFGRLLISFDNSLIDACLYALGNLFSDQDILVQKFKQQFGFKRLLQLSAHLNTLVWVLDTLTSNREYFTQDELQLTISILDSQLKLKDQDNFIHSISTIRNICEYQIDAIPLIVQMKSFEIILEIIQQNQDQYMLHQTAIEIIFSLTIINEFELLKQIENKYNIIDLCVTWLSSSIKSYRLKSLISLTNLCDVNEYFVSKLAQIPYFIEKLICITSQTEQKQIIQGLQLILSMQQYNLIEVNQLFLKNKLINLISQTLEFLNDKILLLTGKILLQLFETIDYYVGDFDIPGNEKQKSYVYFMNQINKHDIISKLAGCCQNVKNSEVFDTFQQCIDFLDKTQDEIN